MILYFADRQLNILGHASTELPEGLTVIEDLKTEDVETGVAVFECVIPFDKKTRSMVEGCTELGNYILRSHEKENEFYTIIEAEIDTKNQEVYIYAEDAGLDLLNEVFGAYEADQAYPIEHYINKFAYDSGFEIGINEAAGLTRKLSWDGNATATERIASVATQFGGFEISYSYDIDRLEITRKYINIHKERGQDNGVQLRLNKEIDRIIAKKTIRNLATALECKGGIPEDEEDPITLDGYSYDDGDFYVSGSRLYSREALTKWSRYNWSKEPNQLEDNVGHIVGQFEYDTTSQATLCAHAITELKKAREVEANYEVDFSELPEGTKVGDWVNVIDDDGELYVSARILLLEVSVANEKKKVTLGEYLFRSSGISQKVAELATQFAKTTQSTARALVIADNAVAMADEAQAQANSATSDAANAQSTADAATAAAATAQEAAAIAQAAADTALAASGSVGENVEALEETVANAQEAADNAQAAADTAQAKADEASQAAINAQAAADEARETLEVTQAKVDEAIEKAETAQSTADGAKTDAATAQATAEAAKADAEQAQKDIEDLKNSLETISNTMTADYVRTTDLTETTASLESQISQNAAEINSAVSQISTIDETANNAQEQAAAAQTAADTAQAQADKATADAQAAQTAADNAATAAAAAQSEADAAKAAAATAQSVADKAQADLEAAQADLATVTSRVDATEEEIEAAQQAVVAAQTAADNAHAEANTAAAKAAEAQTTANTAVTNAANAQTVADNAASNAALAQKTADEAKGNASAAQARAEEAVAAAAEAQETADTAVANAASAQSKADAAAQAAADAQSAADDADAKAAAAAADLATAKQNLVDVVGRVDATEADVEEAKNAVITAQAAADKAQEEAEAAQATADTAKANAATAQTAANNARTAADNAQAAADEAQKAADDAQAAVDALAVRVTSAETKITQNSEQIALMAKKTEVEQTLGGYYTKEETESAIKLESDSIKSTVSSTYATKQAVEAIEIGGRNLAVGTSEEWVDITVTAWSGQLGHTVNDSTNFAHHYSDYGVIVGDLLTFSVDLNSINKPVAMRVDCHTEGSTSTKTNYGKYIEIGQAGRSSVTVQVTEDYPYFYVYVGSNGSVTGNTTEQYKCFKVEKGNKATDWTPAPEDVESGIYAAQETADDATESATTANERVTTAESLIQQLSNCIAMLVTDENGESLMTQTENGWTFSMKETAEAVSSLTSLLETLQQESGSTQATVETLQQAVRDYGETLEYVTVTTYEDEPCIELGESDSNFKLMITNTRIMFMNGANVPTYINTNGIVTQNIEVKGEIVQGGYVMLNTSDGGWGLLWKGVSS